MFILLRGLDPCMRCKRPFAKHIRGPVHHQDVQQPAFIRPVKSGPSLIDNNSSLPIADKVIAHKTSHKAWSGTRKASSHGFTTAYGLEDALGLIAGWTFAYRINTIDITKASGHRVAFESFYRHSCTQGIVHEYKMDTRNRSVRFGCYFRYCYVNLKLQIADV